MDYIYVLIAKVNGAYYCDLLLSQQLLPMMRDVSGEFFIFQQDSAPAHQTRYTVRLLELATPALFHRICGHQTVPTSIQLTTRYGVSSSSECISHGCTTLTNLAAFDARLAWHLSDHHWRCNWRVMWPSLCLCVGKGWTLWTNVVTILRGLSFSRVTETFHLYQYHTILFRKFTSLFIHAPILKIG